MLQINIIQLLEKTDESKDIFKAELAELLPHLYNGILYRLPNNFSYDTYEYLINNGLDPYLLLEAALNIDDLNNIQKIKQHQQMLNLAFELIANRNLFDLLSNVKFPYFPSIAVISKMLDNGLLPNKVLNIILNVSTKTYNSISGKKFIILN